VTESDQGRSDRLRLAALVIGLAIIASALTIAVVGARDGCSKAGLTGWFGYTPSVHDRIDPQSCDVLPITRPIHTHP
jgi:hypothetical protein